MCSSSAVAAPVRSQSSSTAQRASMWLSNWSGGLYHASCRAVSCAKSWWVPLHRERTAAVTSLLGAGHLAGSSHARAEGRVSLCLLLACSHGSRALTRLGATSFTISVLHEHPPAVVIRRHIACNGVFEVAALLQFVHCSSGFYASTAVQHMHGMILDSIYRLRL